MNLNIGKWKYFKVKDIFNVNYGVNLELNACEETILGDPEAINFVSRTQENNGVSAYVKPIEGIKAQHAGIITVAGGGSVLSTFVQSTSFYSGRDLYLLIPKDEYKSISLEAKLFICTVIMANKYRYNYGRQANKTLPDLELKLPAIGKNTPDWKFMEDYIKSLHSKPLTTKNKNKKIPALNVDKWEEFTISKLFTLEIGKANQGMLEEGNECFYVGAKRDNNGVMIHCAYNSSLAQKGNCIIFICNGEGSVGYANYMDVDFIGTTDIVAGYNKNLNSYNGLFIATVLCMERPKYSFGRKWKTHLKDTIIKLPIQYKNGKPVKNKKLGYTKEGYVPDWEFMENYIKALPYGDRI